MNRVLLALFVVLIGAMITLVGTWHIKVSEVDEAQAKLWLEEFFAKVDEGSGMFSPKLISRVTESRQAHNGSLHLVSEHSVKLSVESAREQVVFTSVLHHEVDKGTFAVAPTITTTVSEWFVDSSVDGRVYAGSDLEWPPVVTRVNPGWVSTEFKAEQLELPVGEAAVLTIANVDISTLFKPGVGLHIAGDTSVRIDDIGMRRSDNSPANLGIRTIAMDTSYRITKNGQLLTDSYELSVAELDAVTVDAQPFSMRRAGLSVANVFKAKATDAEFELEVRGLDGQAPQIRSQLQGNTDLRLSVAMTDVPRAPVDWLRTLEPTAETSPTIWLDLAALTINSIEAPMLLTLSLDAMGGEPASASLKMSLPRPSQTVEPKAALLYLMQNLDADASVDVDFGEKATAGVGHFIEQTGFLARTAGTRFAGTAQLKRGSLTIQNGESIKLEQLVYMMQSMAASPRR